MAVSFAAGIVRSFLKTTKGNRRVRNKEFRGVVPEIFRNAHLDAEIVDA
jgi:hypothetical protein